MDKKYFAILQDDYTQLSHKIEKLSKFLDTPQFEELSNENMFLLEQQFEIMLQYQHILLTRIKLNEDVITKG
jgi:hypothetical protein